MTNFVSEKEFVPIRPANRRALASIVDQIRGKRPYGVFMYECGFSIGSIRPVIYGKSDTLCKRLSEEIIDAMIHNADPSVAISKDTIMAANGMVSKKYLKAIKDRESCFIRKQVQSNLVQNICVAPSFQDGDLSCTSFSFETCASKKEYEYVYEEEQVETAVCKRKSREEKYLAFIDDAALLASSMDEKKARYINTHLLNLFEDKGFRFLVHEYANLKRKEDEARLQNMEQYFLQPDRDNLPESQNEATELFNLINELL